MGLILNTDPDTSIANHHISHTFCIEFTISYMCCQVDIVTGVG